MVVKDCSLGGVGVGLKYSTVKVIVKDCSWGGVGVGLKYKHNGMIVKVCSWDVGLVEIQGQWK